MEFKKCSRCGNFYISNGMVCPKCTPRDNYEYSSFKSYIERNGTNNSIDNIAQETGLSKRNINRFMEYNAIPCNNDVQQNNTVKNKKNLANLGNLEKQQDKNGITFLI